MNTHPVSGWASALRVHRNTISTTVFKTLVEPCQIAMRAGLKKCVQFTRNRSQCCDIWTSLGAHLWRILSPDAVIRRLPAHCRLKTYDSQRSCDLRSPYATDRCNSAGVLEQMPAIELRHSTQNRTAPTATSPLRSTLIVNPRSPSGLAKSEPY